MQSFSYVFNYRSYLFSWQVNKLTLVWGKPRQPPLGPEEVEINAFTSASRLCSKNIVLLFSFIVFLTAVTAFISLYAYGTILTRMTRDHHTNELDR